ncbi:glycosyltransferase family 4 protein [Flavobacteriaceae bacterium]|nr:glycosyltransferase family 4 protein [Flavobacteriaceae bacterium]
MNLIYFNLSTDIKDPSLSFTTNWLNKISKNYDNVFLITLKGDLQHLNPNIKAYKLYNQNSNKLIALFRLYNYLFRILSKHKIERCFSHMNPLFLSLTLGSLKILGIKTILWYTHPSVTLKLKLATYFSDRIITASKKSFPINTKKLTPVGHAIETSLFKKIDTNKKYVSCVGRISKSKNIDVLIKAFSLLKIDRELLIVGSSLTSDDILYKKNLIDLVSNLKIKNKVKFIDSVKRDRLINIYNESIVHVNLTSEGFLDKVALEAMSCGTISLSSNDGYGNVYGDFSDKLLFKYRNETDLSKKLEKILTMDKNERIMIESKLLKNVKKLHSIETIGKRINDVFETI